MSMEKINYNLGRYKNEPIEMCLAFIYYIFEKKEGNETATN